MGEDKSSYINNVNSSGFPFQIAIEHEVNKSQEHGWKVVGPEHFWKDRQGRKEGFIDLVLAHSTYKYRAVIECKRQLDKSWIFMVPVNSNEKSSAVLLWSQRFSLKSEIGQTAFKAWDQLWIRPSTLKSAFCTMQGQSDNDRPMLERIAADVILMAESLADEETESVNSRPGAFPIIYLPIIVTSAKLLACKFQEADISIQNGMLPLEKAEFVEIPFIQFQKGFQSNYQSGNINLANTTGMISGLNDSNKYQQRSVFIVQSNSLTSFLKDFMLEQENPWADYSYPWASIENILRSHQSNT